MELAMAASPSLKSAFPSPATVLTRPSATRTFLMQEFPLFALLSPGSTQSPTGPVNRACSAAPSSKPCSESGDPTLPTHTAHLL